jgi:hypothetical protein
MVLPLRPKKGGFIRPFGCGWFIKEFLMGNGPHDSLRIDPRQGAPQTDIFHHYKRTLQRATAVDRATREEELLAKRQKRRVNPDNIDKFTRKYLGSISMKSSGCRYHSFVTYFSMLQRLGWVEFTGNQERSTLQDNYPLAPSRRYYRLTAVGMAVPDAWWSNPLAALYGT